MKKDEIFFAENGLTTTSANHIANIAKEKYQVLMKSLTGLEFYDSKVVSLMGSSEAFLSEGITDLSNIKKDLLDIAKLKSLIAWLREAIKAKEALRQEALSSTYNLVKPILPLEEDPVTEEDVIGSWSIKKRNRYYYLDSVCATIGTYIHPGQPFAIARDNFTEKLSKPRKTSGSGRDMVIYTYTPSVSQEEVESTFMDLQETYRNYQSELNSMKYEIEETVKASKIDCMNKNSLAYNAYSTEQQKYTNELALLREKEAVRISHLKIVIPDALQDIYNQVKAD